MSVTLFLASVSLVGLSGLALHAAASRVGDAQHGNTETGMFYIFGPEIVIVGESGKKYNSSSSCSGASSLSGPVWICFLTPQKAVVCVL